MPRTSEGNLSMGPQPIIILLHRQRVHRGYLRELGSKDGGLRHAEGSTIQFWLQNKNKGLLCIKVVLLMLQP